MNANGQESKSRNTKRKSKNLNRKSKNYQKDSKMSRQLRMKKRTKTINSLRDLKTKRNKLLTGMKLLVDQKIS